jgi:hypothetical protein
MRAKVLHGIAAIFLLGAGFVYGYLAHRNGIFPAPLIRRLSEAPREDLGDRPPGRWNRVELPEALTPDLQEEIERLRAIGYLSGSDAAPAASGVTVHREAEAWAGLNLYTSGHAPEAILTDMDGAVLHTWSKELDEVWPPGSAATRRAGYFEVDYWRRAHLFENGDLLAIYEGFGIIKLDRDSNLLWSWPPAEESGGGGGRDAGGKGGRDGGQELSAGRESFTGHDELGAHHDLFVDDESMIWVLTRRAGVVPRINGGWPILEDFITVLTPDGEPVASLSLLEAFERSPFAPLLMGMADRGDLFHTNTLEIFDGRHAERAPIFRKGNALISLRELNTIAIVDTEAGEVVWAIAGMAARQHQPTLLDNGNLLLFDNLGAGGRSRVVELDPLTQQIVWEYPGAAPADLFSETCGSNQRLPNGNTLITETDRGRAIEVNAAGEIVWELFNPHRAGEQDELIASLFEVVRLPLDFAAWLE